MANTPEKVAENNGMVTERELSKRKALRAIADEAVGPYKIELERLNIKGVMKALAEERGLYLRAGSNTLAAPRLEYLVDMKEWGIWKKLLSENGSEESEKKIRWDLGEWESLAKKERLAIALPSNPDAAAFWILSWDFHLLDHVPVCSGLHIKLSFDYDWLLEISGNKEGRTLTHSQEFKDILDPQQVKGFVFDYYKLHFQNS